ncbi:MAG: DNA polymerase Y family protein [Pseudomonadota bacterium]
MPYWFALIGPSTSSTEASPAERSHADEVTPLGWWALQFTPRVALWEECVLFEVQASLRLFGGAQALRERVVREAAELGCQAAAVAPTAWGALAVARCHARGLRLPQGRWTLRLDAVPLECLPGLARHQPVLARLGCRTLGDVRRLPRGGVARRFGPQVLQALDRAYGLQPERFEWLQLPEVFAARLELPGRVEDATGLLFGARRLVLQLCGWLAARQAGVREVVLQWRHDFHRPGVDDAGELCIRTAELTREPGHLLRLMSERLARTPLAGPVGELRLRAETVEPWSPDNRALALEAERPPAEGESLVQLLERLSARLGAEQVLRPVLRSDHRLPQCERWVPAAGWTTPAPLPDDALPAGPRPTWWLPQPLPLATRQGRPHHHGPLRLLSGPHRVETGWWDGEAASVARDYFVAHGEQVGLLWVYRERRDAVPPRDPASTSGERGGWFLQGVFG